MTQLLLYFDEVTGDDSLQKPTDKKHQFCKAEKS